MTGVVVTQPPATDPNTPPASSPDTPTGGTPIQEQTEPPPGGGNIAAIFCSDCCDLSDYHHCPCCDCADSVDEVVGYASVYFYNNLTKHFLLLLSLSQTLKCITKR